MSDIGTSPSDFISTNCLISPEDFMRLRHIVPPLEMIIIKDGREVLEIRQQPKGCRGRRTPSTRETARQIHEFMS